MTKGTSRALGQQEISALIGLALVLGVFTSLHAHGLAFERTFLFIIAATFLSFYSLKFLGYFALARIFPRKSDLLLMIVAVPLGVLSAMLLEHAFSLAPVTLHFVALLWTPILAILIFFSNYGLILAALRLRGKRKIVLDLSARERSYLLHDFTTLGLLPYVEFLDRADLEVALNNGTASTLSLVVISRSTVSAFTSDKTLLRAHLLGVPIIDHGAVSSDLTGRTRLTHTDLWGYVMNATPQSPLLRAYSKIKFRLEPVIAAIALLILSPVLLLIALIAKITSRGAVLYAQSRIGYLDKPFTLYKFRSMREDAENGGPQWAADNDQRATRFGSFLRQTRLDELPQLWNVMRGEMSFFGPRPERPEIVSILKREVPLFSLRTVVRPGITGWAQVCYGYAASIDESRRKLEHDLFYIQHMSPRLDLIILIKTIQLSLFGGERVEYPMNLSPAEFPRAVNQ